MTFENWWKDQPTRVTAASFMDDAREIWDAGTLSEREACAKLCDEIANNTEPDDFALDAVNSAAAAIRGRNG